MNYPEIILNAYLIENNREHLEAYFTSQYKQAEQAQFVEAELFFSGCIKAIESWENDLRRQVNERKKELYSMLMIAKRGLPSGNEQERLQTIEYCQQELKDERPDGIGSITYNVHLHSLTNGRVQGNVPYSEVLNIKLAILEAYKKAQRDKEPLQPVKARKSPPVVHDRRILIKNQETIESLFNELKGYFPSMEQELLTALEGGTPSRYLYFPNHQNKLVEVFRRLKYNGYISNSDTEIKDWICETFQFKKKGNLEPQPFNPNTVWDILNKGKGEPSPKQRICKVDWLPHKWQYKLRYDAQQDKL